MMFEERDYLTNPVPSLNSHSLDAVAKKKKRKKEKESNGLKLYSPGL